ncbi:MAG: hypothetical protein HYT72_01900 [Candidatus Aenigmarchaeota archaeon]|nr:hypothetical protein [Candidatus Aenigmarchaeota archaeon]
MRYIIFFLLILSFPINAANVTVFVSPDSSFAALKDFLAGSKDIKIASYTFTSMDVADLLTGKNVTIITDDSPVGGLTNESRHIFCSLKNASIYLYSGPLRFMHAKYVISGDKVLVSSENFGDSGFPASPTHGNRGWGAVVEDKGISEALKEIFAEDLKSSKKFACERNYTVKKYEITGNYRPVFAAKKYAGDVSLIVAPNAVKQLVDLINSANHSILVEQFYIYRYFDRKTKTENPLLEALINAARRGVNVSVLLDSYFYNVESEDPNSNLYTAEYINDVGKRENLSLKARLIDLGSGIEKLHNKGLIADDSVLISSINWNENSPARNREIGIVIKGEAAGYFRDVFDYDFHTANRMSGFAAGSAAARNYIGIALIPVIIIFLFWLRKRSRRSI